MSYSPDKLTIETPEQIPLEFPLAGIGSRFLAIALDTLIQAAGFVLVLLFTGLSFSTIMRWSPRAQGWTAAIIVLLLFALYSGYYVLFEIFWNGQTPGKRVTRLRVIGDSGRPITVYEAIARNLLRIVDQLPGFYGVGIISVFLSRRNKRVGDIVAGTVVVHEKAMQDLQPDFPLQTQGSSAPIGASTISIEELELIERFLQRRYDLDLEVRRKSAEQIAAQLCRRLGLAPDLAHAEDLLESLAREKRNNAYSR